MPIRLGVTRWCKHFQYMQTIIILFYILFRRFKLTMKNQLKFLFLGNPYLTFILLRQFPRQSDTTPFPEYQYQPMSLGQGHRTAPTKGYGRQSYYKGPGSTSYDENNPDQYGGPDDVAPFDQYGYHDNNIYNKVPSQHSEDKRYRTHDEIPRKYRRRWSRSTLRGAPHEKMYDNSQLIDTLAKKEDKRKRRHVGPHDDGGIQRLLSTGTLAPPTLSRDHHLYNHSMDVVFATYWFYPAKTKVLLPEDQKCLDEKLRNEEERFHPDSKSFTKNWETQTFLHPYKINVVEIYQRWSTTLR